MNLIKKNHREIALRKSEKKKIHNMFKTFRIEFNL
jgi:hypothetical protein